MKPLPNEKVATPKLLAVTTWVVRTLLARDTILHLALMLVFVPAVIRAQVALDPQFLQTLEKSGLQFQETALKEYATTLIRANPHMNYELAIRSKKLPLEVRYAIRRWEPTREDAVTAEAYSKAEFQTVLLNIAKATDSKNLSSGILNSVKFDTKAVQNDFNAEWGASALVIPKKEFAGGFDRCMVVYIYRNSVGAYVFYMFNHQGREPAMEELGQIFTILHFR